MTMRPLVAAALTSALLMQGNNAKRFEFEGAADADSERKAPGCQYVPRRGRPETYDGVVTSTDWKKVVSSEGPVTFLECKAKCDRDESCVAFVRRAQDDVGYLGNAVSAAMAAKDDSTKLLQVPDDSQVSDCWLMMAGNVKKYNMKVNVTGRQQSYTPFDVPFQRLRLESKMINANAEKVTYEKRNCGCDYRFLGMVHESAETKTYKYKTSALAECEGEYRFVGKEFPDYGVESVYQRTDGQKFIYLCSPAVTGKASNVSRDWYCFDKNDPAAIAARAKEAGLAKQIGFLFGGQLTEFHDCLGQKLERPPDNLPLMPADLPLPGGSSAFPRQPRSVVVADRSVVTMSEPTSLSAGQGEWSCAADKEKAANMKKDFHLRTSQCHLEVDNKRLNFAKWMNSDSKGAKALIKAASLLNLPFGFKNNYQAITKRSMELWEKVERAVALINYIQDGVSAQGGPLTEGEKFACAKLMEDEIKAAQGIMPKVAQTLAMKPDVVKDDFVRASLKTTQTDNPAKPRDEVKAYVNAKLAAAIENQDSINEGTQVVEDIDELLELGETLATGSVAQVMTARVKKTSGWEHELLCGEGNPGCTVVLKVVFDTNEQKYQDDWDTIKFLGDHLLTALKSVMNNGFTGWVLERFGMSNAELEQVRNGISAGTDTWMALKQGLGAIMDEFDLRIEDQNAKKGMAIIQAFDADKGLKQKLGIGDINFDVPRVLMTRSRYIMIQTFAKGSTLTSYHASISGQASKVKEWRTQVYPAIIGLYGHLIVEKGFFQGDPHPGNWYWEQESKTLTLIDWGLADDFSAGFGRAGVLYRNVQGEPLKLDGVPMTQEHLDQMIHENKCRLAKFYRAMAEFRRKELVCKGFELTGGVVGEQPMLFTPSAGPTMILVGTKLQFMTKYRSHPFDANKAFYGDNFFGTPNLGVADPKPLVVQRRRQPTCCEAGCGFGWEIAEVDAMGAKTFVPKDTCVDAACVQTSLNIPDPDSCKETCTTVECYAACDKFSSDLPAKIGSTSVRPLGSMAQCKELNRTDAYAKGAATLGYKTDTMHPVVLALFASLHTNDVLDLKARQENIEKNDPKETGVSLPDYSAVLLRCLQVFLGMVQDMIQENTPPFVPFMVTEFLMDTGPDEMFTYWHIFAERFLASGEGKQCPA
eukprot:gb/GFBE01042156.1/.p1 GENE.gb/GFBE01042156.1/~~gb/GFBE01042156.1/.p1  ORF type:complete len:1152 (+),score=290.65 gb/GFBE01042156.1/:1-3456(+)